MYVKRSHVPRGWRERERGVRGGCGEAGSDSRLSGGLHSDGREGSEQGFHGGIGLESLASEGGRGIQGIHAAEG